MRDRERCRDRGERVRSTEDKMPLHMRSAHPPMLYPFFKALPDQDQLKKIRILRETILRNVEGGLRQNSRVLCRIWLHPLIPLTLTLPSSRRDKCLPTAQREEVRER
jgi:hypothetical protein